MLAFLYPPRTVATPTDGDPWLTLAITGAVLFALVLLVWAAMRRSSREEAEGTAVEAREMPRAA